MEDFLKEMLIKYLCMALPYKLKVSILTSDLEREYQSDLTIEDLRDFMKSLKFAYIKPYLRPISSMTQREFASIRSFLVGCEHTTCYSGGLFKLMEIKSYSPKLIDWMLKNRFDFMDLIPSGLAIEVTPSNDPYTYTVNITEEILGYIDANAARFENPRPELGEEWVIASVTTYPNVNNGQPVVELRREGNFMRLPKDIVL